MSPLRCASLLAVLALVGACSDGDSPDGSSAGSPPTTAAAASSSTSTSSTGPAPTDSTADPEPLFELISEFDADAESAPTGNTWAVLSPDGSLLFVGTASGDAVFDVATGTSPWALDAELGTVRAAAFDPTGRRLATGHQDGGARVWDAATGALVAERVAPDAYPPIDALAVGARGSTVASSSWVQGTTTVWDVGTGDGLFTVEGGGPVDSPDGAHLATVEVGVGVTLWDAVTGDRRHDLVPGSPAYTESVVFSPDGSMLAVSGSFDDTGSFVTAWDTATGAEVSRVSSTSLFATPRWSEDGDQLLVRLDDEHTVVVLDPRTGRPEGTAIRAEADGAGFADAVFVRGDLVMTATSSGAVGLWSPDGEPVAELSADDPETWVFRMAVSDDRTTVAVLSDDGRVDVWRHRDAPPLSTDAVTDSTDSTDSTAGAPSPPPVLDPDALLRGDGLGPWRFGGPAAEVERDLTERLGPPSAWETVRGARLSAARYPAERELRIVSWPWGIDAVFSDLGADGTVGDLRFVAWRYAPFGWGMTGGLPPDDWELMGTPAGITVGTPLADLRRWYGDDVTFDADGACVGLGTLPLDATDPFAPPRYDDDRLFVVATTGVAETGLRGQADRGLPAYVGRLEAGVPARCPGEERAPAASTETDPLARPVLHGDGLDRARFGDPAAAVLADLERLLGPPDLDASRANAGEQTVIPTIDIRWGTTGRVTIWHEAGLTVVCSDTLDGLDLPAPRTGDLRFAAWVAGPRLRTEAGGGVGAGVDLLAASVPELRIGQTVETPFGAVVDLRAFAGADGLRGFLEPWDVVLAVELRLVELGYDLDADGRWMQPTTDALRAAAAELGLDPDQATNPPSLPLVEALGIVPPGDTVVAELAAGANGELTWHGGPGAPSSMPPPD